MALPSSGNSLSITQIQGEFGGSNPASLSEYYSAHSSVPSTGNAISISDFYGLSDVVNFTYELIGGGGGGGHGFDGGAGDFCLTIAFVLRTTLRTRSHRSGRRCGASCRYGR